MEGSGRSEEKGEDLGDEPVGQEIVSTTTDGAMMWISRPKYTSFHTAALPR